MTHKYCVDEQFPLPPASYEQMMSDFNRDFLPAKDEVEKLGCLSNIQGGRRESVGGLRLPSRQSTPNLWRRTSPRDVSGGGGSSEPPTRPLPVPKQQPPSPRPSIGRSSPSYSNSDMSMSQHGPSTVSSKSSSYVPVPELFQTPGSFSSMGQNDYFTSRERRPQSPQQQLPTPRFDPRATSPSLSSSGVDYQQQRSPSVASTTLSNYSVAASAKKKAPPPKPKPKPTNLSNGLYATVQYDFEAQRDDELTIREGERLRILKKSDNTDDWWEGEIRGFKGMFPANYVTI